LSIYIVLAYFFPRNISINNILIDSLRFSIAVGVKKSRQVSGHKAAQLIDPIDRVDRHRLQRTEYGEASEFGAVHITYGSIRSRSSATNNHNHNQENSSEWDGREEPGQYRIHPYRYGGAFILIYIYVDIYVRAGLWSQKGKRKRKEQHRAQEVV